MIKPNHALKAILAVAMLAMLIFPLPGTGYPCHVNQNQAHCVGE